MSLNFLDVQSSNKRGGEILRITIFVTTIVVGCSGLFLYYNGSKPTDLVGAMVRGEKLAINETQEVDSAGQVVGGDEPVVPKEKVAPFLKEEAVEFNSELITAESIIVKEKESGAVLYGKEEYESRPIASISKLMSALVLLDLPVDWSTTTIGVSDEVFDIKVLPGKEYKAEDLWVSGLVGSSNRAILSLVNISGLSRLEFVGKMNERAKELGMMDTSFADPTGLSEYNLSTASDIALLLGEALRRDEILLSLLVKEFTVKTLENEHPRHMWNTDWILLGWIPHEFDSFIGGKTGYIPASGYNFCMEVEKGGHVLQVVVLGADENEDRFTEARDAAEWVFDNYLWP